MKRDETREREREERPRAERDGRVRERICGPAG